RRHTRCYRDWSSDVCSSDLVIDQEWVQLNLARVRAKTEYLTLINWKVASGSINPAIASSAKVFGTEFFTEGYRLLLEIVGQAGRSEERRVGKECRWRWW